MSVRGDRLNHLSPGERLWGAASDWAESLFEPLDESGVREFGARDSLWDRVTKLS